MFQLEKCESSWVNKILCIFSIHHYDKAMVDGRDYGGEYLEHLITKIDPTPKKRYHKWLFSLITQNPNVPPLELFENVESWRSVLNEFDCVKKYFPVAKRDIGGYLGLEDLRESLYAYRWGSGRASRTLLAQMDAESVMQEAHVEYEGQDITIFKPRSVEQAILLGEGTSWRFDDRDGGLYKSLRRVGIILIWFTPAGRFLSVMPYEKGNGDLLLDEDAEYASFSDIAHSGRELVDDDDHFVTAVVNADSDAPFTLNWSTASKIKSVATNPELINKPEILMQVEEIARSDNESESFWAKSILKLHKSESSYFDYA